MAKIVLFGVLEFFILKTTVSNLIDAVYGMLTFAVIPIIVVFNIIMIVLFRNTIKIKEEEENAIGRVLVKMIFVTIIGLSIIIFNNSVAENRPHFHWNFG